MPAFKPPEYYPVTVGGEERNLHYDFNALAALEKETGIPLGEFVEKKSLGAVELRAFLWAGLLHENKDLTLEQVGGWMNPAQWGEIMKICSAALYNVDPELIQIQEKTAGKKKKGTDG